MISCKEISETASDIIDGEYSGKHNSLWQKMQLRFHLIMCKHCRRYMQQLKLSIGIAQKAGEISEPTDDEIDRMVEKLEKHEF